MSIVDLKDVKKTYSLGQIDVEAVKGVNISIEKGDFISIAGPSGSGKTTILNMIGCIDTPTSGEVRIADTVTNGLSDKKITNLRHEVLGFIFQSFNLIPVLNVYENIEFPLLLGKSKLTKKETKEWVGFLIKQVDLQEWSLHKPNELSGGQRQRVAIARALVNNPSIILADEPTGNLDSKTGEEIMEVFEQLHKTGNTIILITHEEYIANHSNRTVRLLDGKIQYDKKNGNGTKH